MIACRLSNGNLLVPMRAESEGVIGDGLKEISPEHPDFTAWAENAIPATVELEDFAARLASE